jgi:peroxiredoxin
VRILLIVLSLLLTNITEASVPTQSYKEALADFTAASKKSKNSMAASDKAIMKRAKAALFASMPSPGIKIGEKAPNFVLNNAFGQSVSLHDELKKGPVVLVFYRGSWCPYCNLHLHVLQKNLPEFKKYGAQLITVTPQKPDRSAEQIKKDGYLFEVLSDLDSQVMKDYKLYFELGDELLTLYDKFNIDLEGYNGKGRNVLPIPGGFVIDQSGVVRAMQAQTDYKSRIEPAAIIEALKSIKASH